MRLLKKLFGKQAVSQGIVSISFLSEGFALAVSKYTNNKHQLVFCGFFRVNDTHELYNLLDKLSSNYQLANYECCLVLPAEEYRRINMETPNVAEDELAAAIRWKIADLIDYPITQAALDHYEAPLPVRALNRKFIDVIVSSKDVLNPKIDLCQSAGLNLTIIDIQETSLRNLATLLPENKRGVAVLHLQEYTGTILIQKDATIYLSRHFDVGYKKLGLDRDLHDPNELSSEQSFLTLEIQRSLDYVENYFGLPPVSSLVTIPIPEHTQTLLNILNNSHGITARIMDISAIIDCDILIDDATQCYCTPVVGATLRYAIKS